MNQAERKTSDYLAGWHDAVAATRPPRILTVGEAEELLQRCEKPRLGPNNSTSDMIIPTEILHELLVVWKAARGKS